MAKENKTEVPTHCSHTNIMEVEKLVPNPKNPNEHPAQQITMLAKIIAAQGWRNPIVISKRSGFVVKGHARLEAAKLNGYNFVPVDQQDYENEAMEYADMVADNRIAELSSTNIALVQMELENLPEDFDLELLGLKDLPIEPLGEPETDKLDSDQWILTVHCRNENELAALHEEIKTRGYECKLIT